MLIKKHLENLKTTRLFRVWNFSQNFVFHTFLQSCSITQGTRSLKNKRKVPSKENKM